MKSESPNEDSLRQFLLKEASGGQLQQTGSFSLSSEKALEKIRLFNFPGPHHWILALIQAFHASEMPVGEIRVHGEHSRTVVEAEGVEGDLLDLLKSELLSFQNEEPDLDAFRRAFWGSLDLGTIVIAQGQMELVWEGKSLETRRRVQRVAPGCLRWSLRPNKPTARSWAANEAEMARSLIEMSELVRERAFAGRIPIFLEGRKLHNVPPVGGSSEYSPLYLAEGTAGDRRNQLVVQPWGRNRLRASLPLYRFEHSFSQVVFGYVCRLDLAGPRGRAGLKITESRSCMAVVKHGVVVHEDRSDQSSPVASYVVVMADQLRTDITGLAAQVEDVKETLEGLADGARWKEGFFLKRTQAFWKDVRRAVLQQPALLEGLDKLLWIQKDPKGTVAKRGFFGMLFGSPEVKLSISPQLENAISRTTSLPLGAE